MGKITKMLLVFAIIFTLVLVSWGMARSVKDVQFAKCCRSHIQAAVKADNIETAKEELSKAIQYAEENDLTEGMVSIFFKQPKNDIGTWYKNMKNSYEELQIVSSDATEEEKTNALARIKDNLTTMGQNGRYVSIPEGIFVYPKNREYFWWGIISLTGACIFWLAFFKSRIHE